MEAHRIQKTWADEMIEKGIEKGIEQGIEQGIEKGLLRGRQEVLLKQLKLKFGPVSDALASRVRAIEDIEVLDELAEKILTAERVEDLGLDPP